MIVEVASTDNPRLYLIRPAVSLEDTTAQDLTRAGFRVRAFDDVADFNRLSPDLAPGCAVLAVQDSVEQASKTGALLKADRRMCWIATGAFTGRLEDAIHLMKSGAVDVLSSPTSGQIAEAARAALVVAFGKAKASRASADALQRIARLSERECQVFDGLIAGGANKVIARSLDLSPRTVETHRAHLMDPLGAASLADLVQLAADLRKGGP